MYVIHFLPFLTIKTLTLRMDHAKLLDVLTSLPVSRSILPRAVYFATSRPANHAICSFIDSSGYASGPIRRCFFIDYIINIIILLLLYVMCFTYISFRSNYCTCSPEWYWVDGHGTRYDGNKDCIYRSP